MADTVLIYPNRDKAESKSMRAAVVLLLLACGVLVLIITVGGWSALEGMQILSLCLAAIYFVMAYYVRKWNRGVLPMAAGIAILTGVTATVAAPAWFARDKTGFKNPALPPSLLGLLSVVLIIVSVLLILFAMRALQQQWNVEIEVDREEADRYRRGEPSAVTS
jgi:lysylphosphatidylglycerol synthetase-like protein (DUF2156 family)